MMTPDQAFEAATELLVQRGQLLNAHLFRLVEADEELYRQVRERLIHEGVAEDRSGVGLAMTRASTVVEKFAEPELSEADQVLEEDWWLMKSGVARGPLDLASLCDMIQHGEIHSADVVRHGSTGLWQRPDDIPLLAAVKSRQGEPTQSAEIDERRRAAWRAASKVHSRESRWAMHPTTSGTGGLSTDALSTRPSTGETGQSSGLSRDSNRLTDTEKDHVAIGSHDDLASSNQFVMPEKTWSLGNETRPGWMSRAWHVVAGMVGGSKRLLGIVLAVSVIGSFLYWWQQPPPASTIYKEFTTCRNVLRKLQDRRVSRAEWELAVDRYRPRITAILARLKSRVSNRYPLESALFRAGSDGLMPMFESSIGRSGPEVAFDQHMETANKLLNVGKPETPK